MKGRIVDISRTLKNKQRLTIEFECDVREVFERFSGQDVEVDIEKWSEKRSNNANRYMWTLLGKLAAVLETSKDELYRLYIQRMGIFKDYHLTEDEAKSFKVAWSMIGTGWLTEQVDFTQDGERLVIRAYYGSSRYNTKQMSRLINEVVKDCKENGIETMTPDELRALLDQWEGK